MSKLNAVALGVAKQFGGNAVEILEKSMANGIKSFADKGVEKKAGVTSAFNAKVKKTIQRSLKSLQKAKDAMNGKSGIGSAGSAGIKSMEKIERAIKNYLAFDVKTIKTETDFRKFTKLIAILEQETAMFIQKQKDANKKAMNDVTIAMADDDFDAELDDFFAENGGTEDVENEIETQTNDIEDIKVRLQAILDDENADADKKATAQDMFNEVEALEQALANAGDFLAEATATAEAETTADAEVDTEAEPAV